MANYTLIGEGENINTIEQAISGMREGAHGQLRLYVTAPPPQEALAAVQDTLVGNGATLTAPVVYDGASRAVEISFRKAAPVASQDGIGFSTAQIVGMGVGALVVVGAMVFAWQLLQSLGGTSLAGLWIVIGIFGIILFVRSAEGKAVFKYAGKQGEEIMKTYRERRLFIDRPTRQDIQKAASQYWQGQAQASMRQGVSYPTERARGAWTGGATGYSAPPARVTESDVTETGEGDRT